MNTVVNINIFYKTFKSLNPLFYITFGRGVNLFYFAFLCRVRGNGLLVELEISKVLNCNFIEIWSAFMQKCC